MACLRATDVWDSHDSDALRTDGPRGFKSRIRPPYPQRVVKGD